MSLNKSEIPNDVLKSLERIIKNINIKNPNIKFYNCSKNGDNYSGSIYNAEVSGINENNNNKNIFNFVLKCLPKGIIKTMSPINEMFKREIMMYSEFLPLIYELQNKNTLICNNKSKQFSPVAKIYDSSNDFDNEFLIMENLKYEREFKMKNRQDALDLNHCLLVLKQLGYYHALTLVLKVTNKAKFEYYAKVLTDKHLLKINDLDSLKEFNKLVSEKALKTINKQTHLEVYEKFANFIEISLDTMTKLSDIEINDDLSVITHGDCWTNNLLFKYDEKNEPVDVVLIDWQASRWGSPVYDLAYFFYNCTDQELRDEYFNYCIEYYHKCVSEMIENFQLDPEQLFPMNVLQNHVQKYFQLGLAMAVHTLNIFLANSEELPEFSEMDEINEENIAMWIGERTNHSHYENRMRNVIIDAVTRGFI